MPRHPRLFLPGATYHVYCRVARGEFVFDDDYEALEFIETLRKVGDLDGWTVFAWCLMGNHYHLVLKTRQVDLWRSMARLQGTVARGHNRRHRYLGRLWQSRYKARVIDTDEYFRQVVSYVHLNPVAAGVADDPTRYTYSGHREILGLCQPLLVDRQAVLSGFGSGSNPGSVDDYLGWVRMVAEIRWLRGDIVDLPWWIQARSDDEIADAGLHPDATTFDGLSLAEDRRELPPREYAHCFESVSGYSLIELSSSSRSPRHLHGRIEFTTLAISRYGLRVRDVATELSKHRNSVTNWLNHGLLLLSKDQQFVQRLDHLDQLISKTADMA
jgi:REP element-mobilizing transposase RayT